MYIYISLSLYIYIYLYIHIYIYIYSDAPSKPHAWTLCDRELDRARCATMKTHPCCIQ